METRAHYLLVGGFVLVLLFGAVGFVIWLAQYEFDKTFDRYTVVFEGSVTGLGAGSAVRYSGVKIGEVQKIRLDPTTPSRVIATLEVNADAPIKTDTEATLAIQGLAGGSYVLLTGGTADAPRLADVHEGRGDPVIPFKPSGLSQVLESAPELVEAAHRVMKQAEAMLGPENQKNIAITLESLASLSSRVAARGPDIDRMIDELVSTLVTVRAIAEGLEGLTVSANKTLAEVDSTVETVGASTNQALASANAAFEKAERAASSFANMADELDGLLEENRQPIADFTSTGLYDITAFINEARDVLVSIKRLTTEVERDPARFLFGNQQQGYEAGSGGPTK